MTARLPVTAPRRPVLRYFGGKFRLRSWVLSFLPPHRIYVEPFGGAASVLLAKPRAYAEVYNDLDGEVVNLFRVLRDPRRAKRLRALLELTPFARAEFEDCYRPAKDPVERARRLVARSFMGMSSKGVHQRSGFDTRVNPDGFASRVNALLHAPDAVAEASQRLRSVLIENDSALAVIGRHDRPDALFYIDPPYPESRDGWVYRHRLTDADHRQLGLLLRGVRGMVVLSGYPCPLYDAELFPDWERHTTGALADGARKRTEVLWLNPAASAALRASRAQLVLA